MPPGTARANSQAKTIFRQKRKSGSRQNPAPWASPGCSTTSGFARHRFWVTRFDHSLHSDRNCVYRHKKMLDLPIDALTSPHGHRISGAHAQFKCSSINIVPTGTDVSARELQRCEIAPPAPYDALPYLNHTRRRILTLSSALGPSALDSRLKPLP